MTDRLTYEAALRRLTHEAAPELVSKQEGAKLRCYACGHRCLIAPGRSGVCRVRYNEDGVLRVPWGYVAGLACDPIEKKPFFHVLPASSALSFGMLGCDFHCSFCQNWISSQVLRDPEAVAPVREISAQQVVDAARRCGAATITSTYNEPLITSDWAVEIFRLAKPQGFRCAYVSNGNATPEVLDYLRPWVDFYKIDLKCFREAGYRELGGVLKNVLQTIEGVYQRGFWMEIVTLVVPGFNDDPQEIREMARYIASVSRDIPWHVTAFHSDYQMLDAHNTDSRMLVQAAEIGREEGLRYVYAGNLPGRTQDLENTRCPNCNELLVERRGYTILQNRLTVRGTCPNCASAIPGVWR